MIVDGHEDIAFNVLTFNRRFTESVSTTRVCETGHGQAQGVCTLALPELRAGGVGLVFGTLFALPAHAQDTGVVIKQGYRTADEAHQQALDQLAVYRELTHQADIRVIENQRDLATLIADRQAVAASEQTDLPLGIVLLMEGADPIRTPAETGWWQEQGIRIVGPAWQATRYCGGTNQPGPLTNAGRALMHELSHAGLILDISHMAEESFWSALELFEGTIIASHSNCRVLTAPDLADRHLSDDMIRALIERDAVIGVVLFNKFLVPDWQTEQGKETVKLDAILRHIDHICQLAGNARHVAIGSDFDGGFGSESIPHELDSVADLLLIGTALRSAGYRQHEVDAIMGENWLRVVAQVLPA